MFLNSWLPWSLLLNRCLLKGQIPGPYLRPTVLEYLCEPLSKLSYTHWVRKFCFIQKYYTVITKILYCTWAGNIFRSKFENCKWPSQGYLLFGTHRALIQLSINVAFLIQHQVVSCERIIWMKGLILFLNESY
jgi:hypothetical protein